MRWMVNSAQHGQLQFKNNSAGRRMSGVTVNKGERQEKKMKRQGLTITKVTL